MAGRGGARGVARTGLGLAVVTAATFALVGCSDHGRPSAVVSMSRGMPSGISSASAPAATAAWRDRQTLLVITWWSSSCPKLPTKVTAQGSDRIKIKTREWLPPGDNGCSGDLGPTTSVVRVPKSVDVNSPVTVTVDGAAVRLPAAP
jgi:hypothetical protein